MRQGEGIRYEILFRDETVEALDAANAKEYVRMLRRDRVYAHVQTRVNQDSLGGHLCVFTKRVMFCPYALFS